ncbi:MAG: helix-turn-helix domain-containing protein [Actinomycetota bacterium]
MATEQTAPTVPAPAADVAIVDDPDVARTLLDPLRCRVLATLAMPGSSSTVAAELGEPRQKINHHLRVLESRGLVALVEERPRRGLTERVVVATASAWVLAPELLGGNAPTVRAADRDDDRLSTRYLLAVASRLVSEVGQLARRARAAGKRLPTLTIDTDIRFASATDRAAFTNDLADAVHRLAATYHDESAANGRWHRLIVVAHPRPPREDST